MGVPEVVRRLEAVLGVELPESASGQLWPGHGYTQKDGRVTGLSLQDLGLEELPEEVASLSDLENLYLSQNKFRAVPELIRDLPRLNVVDLSMNEIRSLPRDITEWRLGPTTRPAGSVPVLFLGDNPLEAPPPEIVNQGRAAVRAFFASAQQGERSLNEVRVLLIGDGGAGKTSLVRQLTRDDAEFDPQEPQTHGIRIDDWHVRQSDDDVRVRLWDFGGQEIMHATHQFFLSRRSLYLLVLDGRRDHKAEYWLKVARSFGGDSPVLVVINKIDENPGYEVNRRFLSKKYPNIRSYHRVSCRTRDGIAELREALGAELHRIDLRSTRWPGSWFQVKAHLEQMQEDFIDYEDYAAVCTEKGVSEEEHQEVLLEFLNDLGVALNFRDLSLQDTQVLEPRWITSAVYQIINSDELAGAGGLLELGGLGRILRRCEGGAKRYPKSKHRYIVELMKKFELCFEIQPGSVLVPDLIEVQEPDLPLSPEEGLHLLLRYDFLPRSVLPRLMVRLHRDIERELRWRTGMVLWNPTFRTRAVVKVDHEASELRIQVAGEEHRRDYLQVLLHALREIHAGFETLEVAELVPCPCAPCQESSQPHHFELAKLNRRLSRGKQTVDCGESDLELRIEDVLWGVMRERVEDREDWDVFVSYASRDFGAVSEIVHELKEAGATVWWDEEQIRFGDSISERLDSGIRGSRTILACLSRNQVESGWARAEYSFALHATLSGESARRLVPLVLDNLPDEGIPPTLRDFKFVRRSNTRKYRALLKQLAK